MHYTLLPHSDRKALRREYRIRALIVLCFGLSLAGVIGIVSLFPSFMISTIQKNDQQTLLNALKKSKDSSGIGEIERSLASRATLLAAFPAGRISNHLSDLVEEVVVARNGIELNSISVARDGTDTATIIIQGIAPTRESLLAFKSRLEAISGKPVTLPVSTLAVSKNISFSLQLSKSLQ